MISFTARPFWRSRKPIGIMHTCDLERSGGSEINPKGWWFDPTCDVVASLENFHNRGQVYADLALNVLGDCHAQGCLFWQLEGAGDGVPFYMGDPTKILSLSPEWLYGMTDARTLAGSVIKRFFDRFTGAGLKIGGTIRPHDFNMDTLLWETSDNPTHTLWRKARFAYDRFGWRLFYVDSNVTEAEGGDILPAIVFEKLHRLMPDCLFIPEHEEGGYYRVCAPYGDNTDAHKPTPAYLRRYYEHAFRCVSINGCDEAHYAALLDNEGGRETVMFDGHNYSGQSALIIGALSEGGTDGG